MGADFTRKAIGILFVIVLLLKCSYWHPRTFTSLQSSPGSQRNNAVAGRSNKNSKHRIAKVSVVYGKPNPLYERALQSHERHAQRWGYEMQVLRREIVGGVWDKVSYLLSLVLQELAKPPAEQTEWLWWVDADSIILNPAMPIDTFLPPADMQHIHMVSTRDHNGLNAGILLFRVHLWTVNFLTETLGYPLFLPDDDLGPGLEQEAMIRVLNKSSTVHEGRRYWEGNVYIPRTWINTYEFHHAYEGKKGDMLVHFPGLEDAKPPHMADWLKIIESTPNEWEVPLNQTDYPAKVDAFWNQFRAARDAANSVEEDIMIAPVGTPTSARSTAIAQLRVALQEQADEPGLLQQRLDDLRAAVKREA